MPTIMAKRAPKKVPGSNAFNYAKGLISSASKKIRSAKPKISAGNIASGIGSTFKTGVYKTSYGVSYGVIYSAVFVTELFPEDSTVLRGLKEGADAAFEARTISKAEKKKVAAAPVVEAKVEPKAEAPKATKRKPRAKAAAEAVSVS